jgi:flagellar hook-associated protein 1 FlgK
MVTYASSHYTALREMELSMGVDTDQELQSLLMIEKSYAANAKVIQAIDAMIQTIVEM